MAAPFGAAINYLNLKSGSILFTIHSSLFTFYNFGPSNFALRRAKLLRP